MRSLIHVVSATAKRTGAIAKVVAVIAAVSLPASAFAGSTLGAVITNMVVNTDIGSVVWINTSVTKSGTPASCTGSNQWVLSLSTPLGNQIYAALLSALAAQQTISIWGDGACSVDGVTETMVQFQFSSPTS